MARYIALLRAINAGRGRTVRMDVLRQAFEVLGFTGVETFIASGNVIFEGRATKTSTLEKKIEKGLRESLRIEVTPFVRTPSQLAEIATYKPFPKPKLGRDAEVNVVFLAEAAGAALKKKLKALATDTDEFRAHGREIYWLRHRKPGGPAFSTVALGKAIDDPFTIRSSRTVEKMATKFGRPEE